jgi:hypothetical protein
MVRHESKAAAFCPYIFVDTDTALMRGLIQGLPKQLGKVRMTRAFGVPSKAAPALAPGGLFAASLSFRDRRLADAAVVLQEAAEQAPNCQLTRLLGIRHFPSLAQTGRRQPAVYELVRQKSSEQAIGHIWKGQATLNFYDSPWHELSALAPVRIGPGYRYTFAMTIDDLVHVDDLRR